MSSLSRIATRIWSESPQNIWNKIRIRAGFNKSTSFDRHVWCLSTGRVGTNTVAALGDLMPNVLSRHEPQPLLFGLGKQAFESLGNQQASSAIVAGIETCRRELKGLNQTTYLETSPHVTFVARQLKQVFPNSKFIHIIRHPVDVVRSGMRRKWYSGNPTDIWRIKPADDSAIGSAWDSLDPLSKNIWSWAETNRWIESFLTEIPACDQMLLTSESLFSGNELALREVFEFCGANFPNSKKVEGVLGKRLNSQVSGDFPTIDDWTPEQRNQLHKLASDVMLRFGYET